MSGLARLHKETPIAIEHHMKPFLGLHNAVNEAMHDFYDLFEAGELDLDKFEHRNLFPALDIVEAKDHFTVEAELPGMGEEDIKLSINENRLTIHGEKSSSKKHKGKNYLSREIHYGQYERSIVLPPSADVDKATATFRKGMLWVKIPKKLESKKHSREINIKKC